MKRTSFAFGFITILASLAAYSWLPAQSAPADAAGSTHSSINYTFDEAPLNRTDANYQTSYSDMLDKVTPAVVGVYPSRTALPARRRGGNLQQYLQQNGQGNGQGYGQQFGQGYGPQNAPGYGQGNGPQNGPQYGQRFAQTPDAPDWTDAKGTNYWYIGVGSGCIISSDGYILTNNHVVTAENDQPAAAVLVKLSDGRELQARVVGTDKETDLALIKIDATGLPTIKMADSEKLRVGDIVFAVGNPMDVGTTVTHGIISALGRSDLGLLEDDNTQTAGYEDFIQTDASINPGNSGGPLLDAEGRLVGLNSVIESPSGGSIGIGFAIPSALARHVADDLMADGKVRRGALGVTPADVEHNMAEALHLPNTHGALVEDVVADSPAAKYGLKPGDVVVKINNNEVDSAGKLRYLIALSDPGTAVNLTILRDGKSQVIKVTLADRDAIIPQTNELAPVRSNSRQSPNANNGSANPASGDVLPGLAMTPVTAEVRQAMNLPDDINGLVINDVARDSPFSYEFAVGTVIMQVNQKPVTTVEELHAALKPGQLNLFYVYRNDHSAIVTQMVPATGQ